MSQPAVGGTAQAGLALYRKYRPATFAEVRGQEHVTAPLRQALKSGRINHAYLFSGPRGCGKTSSARILARSLNCVNGPTPDPCGVCDSCVALAPSGAGSIDVIEIDAASHGGVDDARDLRERAFYAPVSGRYKIYIIDEAHMVTSQGFNALLKLVEEPPPHLKFIFATTEPEKVIPTIRSRTHHYPFRLMPPSVMRELAEEILRSEQVPFDPAVLPLVVRAGGGSARDTLSILDQLVAGSDESGIAYGRAVALLGYTDAGLIDEIVDAFAAADGAAVFRAVNQVIEGGHEPRRFAADLLDRFRDLIVIASVPDAISSGLIEVPPDRVEVMTTQAGRAGLAQLTRAAEIVNAGLDQMRGATSPRLLLELLCAQVLLPGAASDERSVLARLERLESGIGRAPAGAAGPQAPTAAQAPVAPAPPYVSAVRGPALHAAPAASAAPQASYPAAPAESAVQQQDASSRAVQPPPQASAAPSQSAPPQAPATPSQSAPSRPAPPQPAPPQPAPPQPAPPQPAPSYSASASAPFQPAPQAPPAPRGTVTTEAIQYGWDGVLQALMARRKVAWMVVRTASVVSLDEAVLTLQFPRPGEAKGFTSSGYEGLLKEVLHERFGINVMIRTIAGGGSAAGPGQGARRGAPQPGAPTAQPGAAPSAPAQVQPPPAQPAGSSAMQSAAVPATTVPSSTVPAAALQAPQPHAAAASPGAVAGLPATSGPVATSSLATAGPATAAGRAAAPESAPPNRAAANSVTSSNAVASTAVPASPVTSSYGSFDDDVPFPSDDDDPYALDGEEIAGSVDAGFELTGISLIQRDLGAQIIAEYEE
ncbi:MAG TPA: DNA polymerase III subunit gamma and tau [Trebonia sp.]|jgi:DNA polymerase-3 subunit gamma/tau|nr:DNA polymerase III subunit gamma and tau [Trebonia sp.]